MGVPRRTGGAGPCFAFDADSVALYKAIIKALLFFSAALDGRHAAKRVLPVVMGCR